MTTHVKLKKKNNQTNKQTSTKDDNNNNKSNAGVLVTLQFIIYALHEN